VTVVFGMVIDATLSQVAASTVDAPTMVTTRAARTLLKIRFIGGGF
jgi:hypothetical protein